MDTLSSTNYINVARIVCYSDIQWKCNLPVSIKLIWRSATSIKITSTATKARILSYYCVTTNNQYGAITKHLIGYAKFQPTVIGWFVGVV